MQYFSAQMFRDKVSTTTKDIFNEIIDGSELPYTAKAVVVTVAVAVAVAVAAAAAAKVQAL